MRRHGNTEALSHQHGSTEALPRMGPHSLWWWCGTTLLLLALTGAGCAVKTAPPPVPGTPHHPEFVYPSVPPEAAAQSAQIENGWRFLQAGNPRQAGRVFQDLLRRESSFHPAATGLGYVELAEDDAKTAIAHFERALQTAAGYVPALVGRGQALLELNRESDAVASFEAALKVDPSLTDLKARVEVLRFRAVQEGLARAKAASDAARLDDARLAYAQAIAASPDSAFLYRELALVERKAGDSAAALENLRRAVGLDPYDARAHAQMGAVLEEQNDPVGALAAYEKARAIDAGEVPVLVILRLRERAALARLPAEYGAIAASPNVTRADLAALIGVRLLPLLGPTRPRQVVVTDLRGHWAQEWILAAVRGGVMETQPNYTFQPASAVRRAELAQTVSRVLALIAVRHPLRARAWQNAKPKIADVAPNHLSYPAVSQAVAAGVLPLDNGAFQLLRPVSGQEATEVMGWLEALAKP